MSLYSEIYLPKDLPSEIRTLLELCFAGLGTDFNTFTEACGWYSLKISYDKSKHESGRYSDVRVEFGIRDICDDNAKKHSVVTVDTFWNTLHEIDSKYSKYLKVNFPLTCNPIGDIMDGQFYSEIGYFDNGMVRVETRTGYISANGDFHVIVERYNPKRVMISFDKYKWVRYLLITVSCLFLITYLYW
jgi:hypothetical protein